MTNYRTFSTLIYSSMIRRSVVFSAVMALGFVLSAVQPVSAQEVEKIMVQVGQRRFNRLKHPVDAGNVQITVKDPAMVRATFDASTNRFYFKGLAVGRTTVTITGSYPGRPGEGGGMGNVLRQNQIPYTHTVDVTVVPHSGKHESARKREYPRKWDYPRRPKRLWGCGRPRQGSDHRDRRRAGTRVPQTVRHGHALGANSFSPLGTRILLTRNWPGKETYGSPASVPARPCLGLKANVSGITHGKRPRARSRSP